MVYRRDANDEFQRGTESPAACGENTAGGLKQSASGATAFSRTELWMDGAPLVPEPRAIHRCAVEEGRDGWQRSDRGFVERYCSEPRLSLSKTVVLRYRIHLELRHLVPGAINLRLGAVRCPGRPQAISTGHKNGKTWVPV